MAVINSLTDNQINDFIAARYSFIENPFRRIAKIIITLSAVYYNSNQAINAREKLRKLIYKPGNKDINIYQFTGKINSLCDKANIMFGKRKMTF